MTQRNPRGAYARALTKWDKAYWRTIAEQVRSAREAGRLAGVTASTAYRKFKKYRLLHVLRRN